MDKPCDVRVHEQTARCTHCGIRWEVGTPQPSCQALARAQAHFASLVRGTVATTSRSSAPRLFRKDNGIPAAVWAFSTAFACVLYFLLENAPK